MSAIAADPKNAHLYRPNVGAILFNRQGLVLVAQIPFAQTTYTDVLAPSQMLGDALLTTDWTPPPMSVCCAVGVVGTSANESTPLV